MTATAHIEPSLAETDPAIADIIRRAIRELADGQLDDRIVDAWMEGDTLVVLSPSFDRLSVPASGLSTLLGMKSDRYKDFTIDEDGSFLYWAHIDLHLGWAQLQAIIHPTAALAAQQRTGDFNRRYGSAIRDFRTECGLKQSDVDGITDRHLRRIERGDIPARSTILRKLARGHELDLNDYLAELAGRT